MLAENATQPVRRVQIRVHGRPAPKGSRNVGRTRQGRMFTREQSKYAAPWSEAVALMAMQATPLEPPYAVAVVFYMPRPAKPSYSWPVVGDIDKLVRCTLDGLVTGRVIKDDRHVIVLTSHQPLWRDCVGEIPGAQIVVESLA